MIQDYIGIGLLLLTAIGFCGGVLLFSALTAQKAHTNPAKDEAYECGLPAAMAEPRIRFSVKFYLIAVLFILFDIETVFLYPWAVVFRDMIQGGWTIFVAMLSFLGILAAAFVYAWRKGALDGR
ncbi:MAG: NADH-quinone oxidoreductase subunit A [Verrucomicrobiae bacterium]|nr:NADH-quinone oxidoreductase subunit A [Verrucomicrobiae bacterium]